MDLHRSLTLRMCLEQCLCEIVYLFVLTQLLRQAGTLLMQREVPDDVNLQAAQVP